MDILYNRKKAIHRSGTYVETSAKTYRWCNLVIAKYNSYYKYHCIPNLQIRYKLSNSNVNLIWVVSDIFIHIYVYWRNYSEKPYCYD